MLVNHISGAIGVFTGGVALQEGLADDLKVRRRGRFLDVKIVLLLLLLFCVGIY